MLRFASLASTFLCSLVRKTPLSPIAKGVSASVIAFLCVAGVFSAAPTLAAGQGYTLAMEPFNPFAVDPGQSSSARIALTASTGFTGTVTLACQVSSQAGQTPPICDISPGSVQPTGSATATVSTASATPGSYLVTVTGTSPGTTAQTGQQYITILSANPDFTITIQSAMVPSSVHAGNGSLGTININPLFGYQTPTGSKGVTLSCATITPLVTIPPICNFNPNPVPVASGTTATSQITITTFGPVPTTSTIHARIFYAWWLPLPMLSLVGLGAATGGRRARKAWGMLALFVVAGSLMLSPACANSSNTLTTTTPNGTTPNNTYTFTLMGVDDRGNVSSNTGTNNTAPTVTLTVN